MENLAQSKEYLEKRERIDELMKNTDFFGSTKVFPTKYTERFEAFNDITLVVEKHKIGEHNWNYTKCVVRKNDVIFAEVVRNYSAFPFMLIKHSNGSRYLLCGEDYQGYTSLNLETGVIKTFIPKEWRMGAGLCITEFEDYDTDTNTLTAGSCIWGGDDFTLVYDLSNIDEGYWFLKERTNTSYNPEDNVDDEEE